MVYFYGYYSQGNLSRAVNHQNYAKFLCNMGIYHSAIYHSDLARRYALRVIYNSNNYWDNYYRPHYYSSHRPPQTNTQYGHRSSNRNVTSTARNSHTDNNTGNRTATRTSKFASSGDNSEVIDVETWGRNYYSTEELSIIKSSTMPSEKELEAAVSNNTSIRRVSNDDEVMKNGIKDFSEDINTFKRSHQEDAKSMAIRRPSDFGTTSEVTRSTANKTSATPSAPARTTTPTQTTTPARNTSTPNKATQTAPARTQPTGTTPATEQKATPTTTPTRNTSTPNKATQTTPTRTQPTRTAPARSTQANPTQKSTTAPRSSSANQNAKKETTSTKTAPTRSR
jgi:hypothetical protein